MVSACAYVYLFVQMYVCVLESYLASNLVSSLNFAFFELVDIPFILWNLACPSPVIPLIPFSELDAVFAISPCQLSSR